MKFLIVSDIHAISGDLFKADAYGDGRPSYCDVESVSTAENPLLSIANCLESYKGQISALLCLGDLAHQAKRLPFVATWLGLHNIADSLDIPVVLGVTGNHDKASRASDDGDLEMQNYGRFVNPSFPSSDLEFNQQYFDLGYAGVEIDDSKVICVDTCRLHGLGGDAFKEVFSVGAISQNMIDGICKLASSTERSKIVVMMHHHPTRVHPEFDKDNDVMANGQTLLDALADLDKMVIVVHGHKHMVAVNYRRGRKADIPILSAASLSCLPYNFDHELSANQFHVIDLDVSGKSALKTGEILSWEWHVSKWKPSKKDYMTHVVPIGKQADTEEIIRQLRALSPTTFLHTDELLSAIPEIEFATKSQIEEINEHFEDDPKPISIWMDSAGRLRGLQYEEIR